MNRTTLKKKAAILAALGIFSFSGSFALYAPPQAEAGLLDFGDVITNGIQIAQARDTLQKYIKALDTTPEGQQHTLENLQSYTGVYDDPQLMEQLGSIMGNMTNAIGQVDKSVYDLPYVYYLTPSEYFNAACGMSHVMMVNQGTFAFTPSEDELAVVIGHEMVHGQAHHSAKSVGRKIDRSLLAQIGSAALGGTELTNILTANAYKYSIVHADKGDEKEADALAWEYITHSNYNPGACAAIWQRALEKLGDNAQSGVDLWLNPSDHPNNMARRDRYEKKLQEYSGKHVAVKDGLVKINGKTFVTPAPAGGMSTAERAYFVEGNLAAAYHNSHNKSAAHAEGNTVMLGAQPIMTCVSGDEGAQTLVDRLNKIK
ncbi:M48 family metallopeptidase [Mitsuokella multacida]|uniref:M48 family metallopeptidase n=1 Tax=Mitsuokella multacida TaxID=52226 RepID=UPI002659069E|nr:M48 family metallopeptidase [Mitsuokella multacida]